jgi:hypothetical protein
VAHEAAKDECSAALRSVTTYAKALREAKTSYTSWLKREMEAQGCRGDQLAWNHQRQASLEHNFERYKACVSNGYAGKFANA